VRNNMPQVIGIFAALAAPLFQVTGFVIWDGTWTGSAFALNLFKCTLASTGFLIVAVVTRYAEPISSDLFNKEVIGYLFLSSLLGIVIGDFMWLEALRLIHAKRVIVVDALKPFIAALLGWFCLEQELEDLGWVGMVCTVAGVLWVSLEHDKMKGATKTEEELPEEVTLPDVDDLTAVGDAGDGERAGTLAANSCAEDTLQAANRAKLPVTASGVCASRHMARGYCYAVGNVVLDVVGLVITRQHGVGLTTWEINIVRFGFACVVMLCVSLFLHVWHGTVARSVMPRKQDGLGEDLLGSKSVVTGGLSDQVDKVAWYALPRMTRRSWALTSCGVLFVTFLSSALIQFALFIINVGLCATLVSVGPLYVIPIAWLMQQQRPTVRCCLGACLAVSGIVLLSISKRR